MELQILNDQKLLDSMRAEHQKLIDKKEVLVEVKDLSKYFNVGKGKTLKAVDGINFNIYKGETFGLVGESGCGKTTVGRTILNIYKPTKGDVIFRGENVKNIKGAKNVRNFKKNAQMIFQDPYSSLDARMTIGEIIGEGVKVHYPDFNENKIKDRVSNLLQLVGLNPEHGARFPHELSGGQRQRVGIARALAIDPAFIVCDEPISALDVSIQAQVVNLLNYLQWEMGLTYLFISHDLSMVQHISDRVGVMYLGNLVELADNKQLYANPLHPYTQALISAIPEADPESTTKDRIKLEGEIPSPVNKPSGCSFHTRCIHCMDICTKEVPKVTEPEPGHFVSCHLYK